ncbi:MAG: molecular chaperone DnaJ [Candidatus Paceibacterota bacterium]
MKKDYYDILGIKKDASQDEIKKAFRKAAHAHHPDKQGGNADKFKEANEAYGVLSDDKKRQQYDQFGHAGANMGGPGGQGGAGFNPNDFGFDFSGFQQGGGFQGGFGQNGGVEFDLGDIFGDVFGGGRRSQPKRGHDISVDVDLSFEEAVFGVEKSFRIHKTSTCPDCSGSGAKAGSKMKTCDVCKGAGKVKEMKRSILGTFATTKTCENCHGAGKVPEEKCHTCHGSGVLERDQEIKVKIPAGLENGETVRLAGGGEAVTHGQSGDLYIKVHVDEHSIWRKEGHNLVTELDVKLSDALLGAAYPLKTLDGDISLKIPEGIAFGEVLRVKGKGVPINGTGPTAKHRGDILVKVNIVMPRRLSKDAKRVVEGLKNEGV